MKECLQTNIMVSHLQIISSVQETNQIQMNPYHLFQSAMMKHFMIWGGGYGFSWMLLG